MAQSLGVSPGPFLMAVAVAASCAFLMPTGQKNNALVLGPGAYSFGDCWRMGLPLEVPVVAVSIPSTLVFWPLSAPLMPQFRHDPLRYSRGTVVALERPAGVTGRDSPAGRRRAMMKIALMVHAGFAFGLAAAAMMLI